MTRTRRLEDSATLEAMFAAYARGAAGTRYRTAPWLISDYDAGVWSIQTNTLIQLDWGVRMHDDSLLTEHTTLWESLRSWLIVSTHVDFTGREIHAPDVLRSKLQIAIHCIDYLLLNAEALGLIKSGLRGISDNEMMCMIGAIASNRSAKVSIYEWPTRLSAFLREKIAALPTHAIDEALNLHPDLLGEPPDADYRLTDLTANEIILARAWLARSNGYKFGDNYRLVPKSSLLIDDIYPHAIGAKLIPWPVPPELCLGPDHRFPTEYPRARVHSERDERMSSMLLNKYAACVSALAVLRTDGFDAPTFTRDAAHRFATTLSTKEIGRFRTLPSTVVFESLRKAIEYALEFGDDLVESYLQLAEAAHRENLSIAQFDHCRDIRPYLTKRTYRMGVRRWSIESANAGLSGGPALLSKHEWFHALRANYSLYEALRVLYGATQIVVGLLMARRVGELYDLTAGECLDTSETRLVFKNRKSGFGGMRQAEGRPIPPIGVRLIKLLDRLQTGLLQIGAIDEKTKLYACPSAVGSNPLSSSDSTYRSCVDLFCDWAETSLDPDGRRYYLRQHQLRRFFAMLFFWGGGFGGMDTLRWFLAHSDVQHLWRYITESTPGVTLRSVAAEWGVYQVKHATEEAKFLADELAEHFGTREFSVLDEEALILHLEDLMEEGRLTIEPQFLDNGRRYRIAVLLKPRTLP